MWACVGYKTESSGPKFKLCLLRWYPVPEESSKFNRKIFQSYWLQNDKNCVPDNVGIFRMQNRAIRARSSTFPAPVETRPGKVIKIRSNYLSTVLTENDRNCTRNCVGTLVVPNVLIWAWFSTLAAPVVTEPRKVIKIWSKHFFAILMENDENCTPKSVGMFRALNRVIWVSVWTFHSLFVLGPETIVKIFLRLFLPVRIKNDKKCVPNSLDILHLSKLSHPGTIFSFDCSGGPRDRKGRQNSTETFFRHIDRKMIRIAYRIMWVCFWCKTESYRRIMWSRHLSQPGSRRGRWTKIIYFNFQNRRVATIVY